MPLCKLCPRCNRHHTTWRISYKIPTPLYTFQGVIGNDRPPSDDYILVDSQPPAPLNDGGTVLHEFALAGNEDGLRAILSQLIQQGRQLKPLLDHLFYRTYDGETPLHLAIRGGHISVIEELLKYNYGQYQSLAREKQSHVRLIEAKDNFGLTPLHLAVRLAELPRKSDIAVDQSGDKIIAIIKLLLNRGANTSTKCFGGASPFSDSSCFGDDTVYAMLQNSALGDEESAKTEVKEKYLPSQDWNRLRAFMSATFWDRSVVTRHSQALAYSNVWNICTTKKDSINGSSGLYKEVERYIKDEVHEIAAAAARLPLGSDSDLTSFTKFDQKVGLTRQQFYLRTWTSFELAALHRDHAMDFLNRHWVRREQWEVEDVKQRLKELEQGNHDYTLDEIESEKQRLLRTPLKEVYSIQELHRVLWNKYFVEADQGLKDWRAEIACTDSELKQHFGWDEPTPIADEPTAAQDEPTPARDEQTPVEDSEWEFVLEGEYITEEVNED